ncbi:MAG: 30S ribosome-binding factor RbfA [Deinococcaceae bacterium]
MSLQHTEEQLHRVLSTTIHNLKDPRIPLIVTVERVRVAKDFSKAKVYISTLGDIHGLIEALNHARGHLQREVSKHVQLRRTPLLEFLDASHQPI